MGEMKTDNLLTVAGVISPGVCVAPGSRLLCCPSARFTHVNWSVSGEVYESPVLCCQE